MSPKPHDEVRLALPKGRMQQGVFALLEAAGIKVRVNERDYRPSVSLEGWNAKILKPRNVIGMLSAGARDVGFAGADWVAETGADVVSLLDTGLDPVRLVAAAPRDILGPGHALPRRDLIVASEYTHLAERWIKSRGLDAEVLTTFGATEVFPPEDADCIVDNTATGSTLRANGLEIIDELMRSSTHIYACPTALDAPHRRAAIEDFVTLVASVLEARKRVMVDLNVSAAHAEAVIRLLPCMREPTVTNLHGRPDGDNWVAVRVAVKRSELAALIPKIRSAGARDIVTTSPEQIIP